MEKNPAKNEILSVLKASNIHSAPGTDSISNYFYIQMFDVVGETLTDVTAEIFTSRKPTTSNEPAELYSRINLIKKGQKS